MHNDETNEPVYVTQPFLPPLDEFVLYLEQIWASRRITNNGPFHQQLEQELCEYLGVEHLALFANGTIALVTALQSLRITGEVITTPYSFVATAHSLVWNNITPVFVDIDANSCNLDPDRIEEAITPQTTAILPVHCYGRPCAVDRIQKIADTYGLKVIYDAAHAFGVKQAGASLLRHGDLSVLSFHATKVFTTFEGGAIVCPDAKTKQRIDYLKNFGFADEVTVMSPGINGKMNEFQAALGLLQLKYVGDAILRRQTIDTRYRQLLQGIPGIECLAIPPGVMANYGYFPIRILSDYPLSRDELYEKFRSHNIHVRRYFYPLISEFPMYRGLPSSFAGNLAKAMAMSRQVLCLPIFPELPLGKVDEIVSLL